MTIQETVETSLKGGFKHPSYNLQRIIDDHRIEDPDIIRDLVLMPDFWQTIGNVLGWGDICINCHNNISFCCEKRYNKNFIYYWHKLIDHFAEGKDIESYFKEL